MNSAHNSAHPAAMEASQLLRECEVRHLRTRGPGGQHRNKVSSGVEIRHIPTSLCGIATERREQSQNHRVAMYRLRVNLALEVRLPADPAVAPIELWMSRVKIPLGRIAVNVLHEDFPVLLAFALDVLETCGNNLASAAAWLKITPSQLIKFLALEPRALTMVNGKRVQQGLRELR